MTFLEYLHAINDCESADRAVVYINDNFIEIQYQYYELSYNDGQNISLDVINTFLELLAKNYLGANCIFSLSLIEMLADYFERYRCVAALFQLRNLIGKNSPLNRRITAALLFNRVNKASVDYLERFDKIIGYLNTANEDGEFAYKSTITFINYYYIAVSSFIRLNRSDLANEFIHRINYIKADIGFLHESIIDELLTIPFNNFNNNFNTFFIAISGFIKSKLGKGGSGKILGPEVSSYTVSLSTLPSKDFDAIRSLSVNYINNLNIKRRNELKYNLDSGVKIIDDPELLYSYNVAFGKMHYSKVWEALEKIPKVIDNKSIYVYDWGCGQALASMIFFEFLVRNKLEVDIKGITLIEPSDLALRRGISHLNFVYPSLKNSITPLCKDLDSILDSDLINLTPVKFHLFSNILDVPYFNLNELCNRISSLKGLNIFICVSPMQPELNRQVRLHKFLEFFSKNFKTQIIAQTSNTKMQNKWKSNYCPCSNHDNEDYFCRNAWTRHEILFSSIIS
jgi:hypothetical protein